MSSFLHFTVTGESPYPQKSGVFEVEISITDVKPSSSQIESKSFSSIWKDIFHLNVKNGLLNADYCQSAALNKYLELEGWMSINEAWDLSAGWMSDCDGRCFNNLNVCEDRLICDASEVDAGFCDNVGDNFNSALPLCTLLENRSSSFKDTSLVLRYTKVRSLAADDSSPSL